MASFIISFQVGQFGKHAERHQSIVQAIRNEAIDGATWEETTSFFVIQSGKTTTALTDAIYYEAGLVAERDTLLVVNVSAQTYAAKGKIAYPHTLEALMQP